MISWLHVFEYIVTIAYLKIESQRSLQTRSKNTNRRKKNTIKMKTRITTTISSKTKTKFNESITNNTIFINDVRFFEFVVIEKRSSTFSLFYTINILISYNDNKIMNKITIFKIFNYSNFNENSIFQFNKIVENRNVIKYERTTNLQYVSFKNIAKQKFNNDNDWNVCHEFVLQ